jgi:hypothetical protein
MVGTRDFSPVRLAQELNVIESKQVQIRRAFFFLVFK